MSAQQPVTKQSGFNVMDIMEPKKDITPESYKSTPSRRDLDPIKGVSPDGIGSDGLALIKKFEGLKLKGYHATEHEAREGIVSGGYGSTNRIELGEEITEAEAEQFLLEDVKKAEKAVDRLVEVPLKQNERDALVSLLYNVGEGNFAKSKALKHLNNGDRDAFMYEAFSEKAGFTKQDGKRLKGLVRRRKAEMELFAGNTDGEQA